MRFLRPTADKPKHDRMVELMEQMLAARKRLAAAQSDKDKDFYTNRRDGLPVERIFVASAAKKFYDTVRIR